MMEIVDNLEVNEALEAVKILKIGNNVGFQLEDLKHSAIEASGKVA